jgi:hypothetical protein
MLKDILLLALGAFFGLGATVAGVAAPTLFPGTPQWVWYWAFWGGIALVSIVAIDGIWLLLWQPRPLSAILSNIALAIFAVAVIAQFSPSYWAQKQRQVVQDTQSLSPLIEALRQSQNALHGQQAAEQIVEQIIQQYDLLERGTQLFEQFAQSQAGTERAHIDRLTSARTTIDNIRTSLGNVRVQASQRGSILFIRTAPNTFRVTYSVPKRAVPQVTFFDLPQGTTPNIVENSNVGFTVIFTPPTISIENFNLTADASLTGG